MGDEHEDIEPPPLSGFGLPNPDALVGIAMRFQIAQKFHAVTDPHDPPDSVNDRARDIVDLLLLRDLTRATGCPALREMRAAAVAVFESRAAEAEQLGRQPRPWPPIVVGHRHWTNDYSRAATSGGIDLPLQDAVEDVNTWITEIDAAMG